MYKEDCDHVSHSPAAPVFPCERGALSGNITVVCSLVSLVRLCGRPQSSLDCETKTEQECLALPDVHCEVAGGSRGDLTDQAGGDQTQSVFSVTNLLCDPALAPMTQATGEPEENCLGVSITTCTPSSQGGSLSVQQDSKETTNNNV